MTPSPIKPSPLPFSLPVSLTSPSINTKRSLLTCFVLAAYIAWSLGAWESFLISSGLRPKLRPVLLLAGDSLTERGTNPKINGWVTLLQNEFTRSANVVPRGLAGYNTRWYLKYAMPVIHGEIVSGTYSPALIMLWLGANDAALPTGSSSEQHVPITQYRDNLIRIVRQFQAMAPDARILLITPPHVDDMARHRRAMKNEGDKHGVADRTNEMAGNYAQVCVATASTGRPRGGSTHVLQRHAQVETQQSARGRTAPEHERQQVDVRPAPGQD